MSAHSKDIENYLMEKPSVENRFIGSGGSRPSVWCGRREVINRVKSFLY